MTLLSAVVLGTDVFALPHRGRRCRGAFVVLCEQVSVSVAQWKKSHSLMNLKTGRKVCSLKYYIIWCVWTIKFEKTMQTPREQTKSRDIFSFCLLRAVAIIVRLPTSGKPFRNREKPQNEPADRILSLFSGGLAAFHHTRLHLH